MKSNAKTLLKVLVATAILCLFTAVGASAEIKTGTFTDAKESTNAKGYEPKNTYTYEFNTETGHLFIDADKNEDGSYKDGEMTLNIAEDAAANDYLPWRNEKLCRKLDVKSIEIGAGITQGARRLVSGTAITELRIPSTIKNMEWGFANECSSLEKVYIGDGAYLGDKFVAACPKLADIYLDGSVTNNGRCFFLANSNAGSTYQNINLHFNPTSQAAACVNRLKSTAESYWVKLNPQVNLPYTEFEGVFNDNESNTFTYKFEITEFPADYDFSTSPALTGRLTVNADKTTYMNNSSIDATNSYPWKSWRDRVSEVVIGTNVTSVGRSMCYGMTALKEVTVPSQVTDICWGAFEQCANLNKVTVESGVKTILQRAFGDCGEFDLYLPDTITTLNDTMFTNRNGGKTSFPTIHWTPGNDNTDKQIYDSVSSANWVNVKYAPDSTYEYDVADTGKVENAIHFKIDVATRTLYITKNNVGNGKMGDLDAAKHPYAWGKWIEKVEFGDGVKRIGGNTFASMAIKSVTFNNEVEEIGAYTINGLKKLEEINFGSQMKKISYNAINGCTALKKVTIGKNLSNNYSQILRYSSSAFEKDFVNAGIFEWNPDIEIIVYDGSGFAEWAHGTNSSYPTKFVYDSSVKKWNTESVCFDVKVLDDDGNVKYVLLKRGSTSTIATEAATNNYEIVYYGEPMIKIADDSASAAFTGKNATGILIATKHDASGNMTAVQLDGVTAKSAGYYTINFDETFKAADGTVTAMLWEGIDTMKPLCASVSK